MNETVHGRHWLRFEPTVSLGTVLHVLGMGLLLVVGWVKMSDRVDYLEKRDQVLTADTDLIQKMQISQATEQEILNEILRQIGEDREKKVFDH